MIERERLLEKMAQAMCKEGGFNPHEMMPNDGPRWKYYIQSAEAALHAIEQSGGYAPAGKWIAPEEPTEEMEMAGYDVVGAGSSFVYKAMHKAAKEQKSAPTQQEGGE